jgi:hypothetical protein
MKKIKNPYNERLRPKLERLGRAYQDTANHIYELEQKEANARYWRPKEAAKIRKQIKRLRKAQFRLKKTYKKIAAAF